MTVQSAGPSMLLVWESRGYSAISQPWTRRHGRAMLRPSGFEEPIVCAVKALAQYADLHRERYGAPIGEDGYLYKYAFEPMARAILAMLNGETGDLDCGIMDGLVRAIVTSNGGDGDAL